MIVARLGESEARRARPPAARQALVLVLLALALPACSSTPRGGTTFLNSVDLIDMTDRMAESFAHDEMIGHRTPQSPPWVVSIYRVQNFTNQVIPDREKWLYVARLRAQLAQSDLSRERNVLWVVPPEQWRRLQRELGDEPPEMRLEPTHQLTARFDALTNTSSRGRSDMYHCSYVLFDLRNGVEVWRDKWEVKRDASGKTYD